MKTPVCQFSAAKANQPTDPEVNLSIRRPTTTIPTTHQRGDPSLQTGLQGGGVTPAVDEESIITIMVGLMLLL